MTKKEKTSVPVVYFSSATGNTKHFVESVGHKSLRIPLYWEEDTEVYFDSRGYPHGSVQATEPYVLVVPAYGGGDVKKSVPKPVIFFLNDPENRALCRGVVGMGNKNFGVHYLISAKVVAQKLDVPLLMGAELMGSQESISSLRDGLADFFDIIERDCKQGE